MDSNLKKNLAMNMRVMRALWESSMDDFASSLNISKNTLQKILKGDGNTTLDTVEQIAKGCEVSPLSLLSEIYGEQELHAAVFLLKMLNRFASLDQFEQQKAVQIYGDVTAGITRLLEMLQQQDSQE